MISKVLCLAALVAAVAAQHGHDHGHDHGHEHHHVAYSSQSIKRHDGPAHAVEVKTKDHKGHEHVHHEYFAYPKYEYEYKVEDKHTHDIKSQHEARDGDHVKGYYELHEPHGHGRKVEYESDKKNGFHATVKHDTHHVIPKHHH